MWPFIAGVGMGLGARIGIKAAKAASIYLVGVVAPIILEEIAKAAPHVIRNIRDRIIKTGDQTGQEKDPSAGSDR